jgi:uncharacterized protein with WD repeat
MADFSFRPKSGRFGVMVDTNPAQIPSASPLTASSTVTFSFSPLYRNRAVSAISASALVIPAGGAAITATIKKWSVAAQAYVALATAFDLTSLTAKQVSVIPFDATVTTAQRSLTAGDLLVVDLICAGTVTTQPTGLLIVAEMFVLQ